MKTTELGFTCRYRQHGASRVNAILGDLIRFAGAHPSCRIGFPRIRRRYQLYVTRNAGDSPLFLYSQKY